MKKVCIYIICFICIFFISYKIGDMFFSNKRIENPVNEKNKVNIEEVVSEEEKISINTKGNMQINYLSCGHTEVGAINFDDTLINLDEDKFKEKFIGWNVKEFSNKNILIEKNVERILL